MLESSKTLTKSQGKLLYLHPSFYFVGGLFGGGIILEMLVATSLRCSCSSRKQGMTKKQLLGLLCQALLMATGTFPDLGPPAPYECVSWKQSARFGCSLIPYHARVKSARHATGLLACNPLRLGICVQGAGPRWPTGSVRGWELMKGAGHSCSAHIPAAVWLSA